jgi:hypothetical protein
LKFVTDLAGLAEAFARPVYLRVFVAKDLLDRLVLDLLHAEVDQRFLDDVLSISESVLFIYQSSCSHGGAFLTVFSS